MTITYVGIGSTVTGNNTSLNPAAVPGIAVGDLQLIVASIRNSGAGVVDTPAGWVKVIDASNLAVLGRFYQAGDSPPTVTFTGGVANADTQAAMIAFRGVAPDALTASPQATLLTTPAQQDLFYPALNVPGASHAVLIVGWKQDDATSIAAVAGFTGTVNSFATAGDDASLRAIYQIQTTAANIVPGFMVVTGGVAAISRAATFALHPAAAITATYQSDYPGRVLVEMTGLVIGDEVQLYRVVAGERTPVRAGYAAAVTDTSFLRIDAEQPYGIPVSYVGVVNGSAEYTTSPATYTLVGGKVVLSDAITGLAVEATIMGWDQSDYDRPSSVFKVGGRNVVVSGDLGQFEADIELYFEVVSSSQDFRSLLDAATEGVVQVRQPGGYDDVDCYIAVTAASRKRFSQDGTDPRRRWVLHAVEVDGWATTLEAAGATLQDIADFYLTGTLTNLNADYATLLAIAEETW